MLARNVNQGCEILWKVDSRVRANDAAVSNSSFPTPEECTTVSTSPRAHHGGHEPHRLASGEQTHMLSRQFAAKGRRAGTGG
jgi:hypothetical protein